MKTKSIKNENKINKNDIYYLYVIFNLIKN